jgi:hypothetical protein
MKTGLFYNNNGFTNPSRSGARNNLYDRIREEVASEYETRLERAASSERDWLNWKIDLLAEIRYNRLVFSAK